MQDSLRRPFLFLALLMLVLIFLLEIGASFVLQVRVPQPLSQASLLELGIPPQEVSASQDLIKAMQTNPSGRPPGYGVPDLALIDGLLLFSVGLMVVSLFLGDRIHGRVQGIATLIVAFLVALASFTEIFKVLGKVIIMIALLVAVPFGTAAYMALYSSFDRTGAGVVLVLLFTLKVGFVVCLLLAQQAFVKEKGLLLLTGTSFLAAFIVGFLHQLPPGFLVSITDAIAGIINAVLALIWALLFLIFSIISVIRAIRLAKRDQRAS